MPEVLKIWGEGVICNAGSKNLGGGVVRAGSKSGEARLPCPTGFDIPDLEDYELKQITLPKLV